MEKTLLSIKIFRDLKRMELTNISNILFNFMKEELLEGNVIEIEMEDIKASKKIIRTLAEFERFKKKFR